MLGGLSCHQNITEHFFPNLTSFLLSFVVCTALTETVTAMTETSSGGKTSSVVTEIRTKIFQWHHQWGRTQLWGWAGHAPGAHRAAEPQWGATLPLNPGSAPELDEGKQPPPASVAAGARPALWTKLPTEAEGKRKGDTQTCRVECPKAHVETAPRVFAFPSIAFILLEPVGCHLKGYFLTFADALDIITWAEDKRKSRVLSFCCW